MRGFTSLRASLPAPPSWLTPKATAQPYQPSQSQPASNPNGIRVSLEDRWLVLGSTGTGKTTFAKQLSKHLLRLYPQTPFYVLESRAAGDFSEWYSNLYASDEVPPLIEKGFQVWRPGADNQAAYDFWFDDLLHAPGPAIILVDEISSIGRGKSNDAPPGFQRILKQGRALGKCLINCSQEIGGTPKQIRTQTTHITRFRVTGEYDPRAANRLMHRPHDAPEPRHKYGFFYTRIDEPTPISYYGTYKDFF